jgi:DNA polymerase III delta subunit
MVAYKSSARRELLEIAGAPGRAVLLYGPDAGLVAERASAILAATFAPRAAGETEIVRTRRSRPAEDPARIEVELRTRSDVRDEPSSPGHRQHTA